MYLVLLLFWFVLNGKITLEITIFGIVICAVLYMFLYKFMDYRPKKELIILKNFWKILKYLVYLTVEIIKANLAVAKVILAFEEEPDPVLVKFRTKVKTKVGQTVVANSITLTPGTITVDLEDGNYLVHSLEREYAVGIHESGFVEKVSEMEKSLEREER